MATVRTKKKLAAMNRENHQGHPKNISARNTNTPSIQEDYFTLVSEVIEVRVTKKLSQEFRQRERCILDALFELDDFLQNSQARVPPEPFRRHLRT